jgi:hypothetical protein
MSIMGSTRKEKIWIGNYDFAIDGGGTGLPQTIVLRSQDGPLPNGAIITGGLVDVSSSVLSATGTIALTVQAANDIVSAVGQASWTAGLKATIPVQTAATMIKLTAERSPSMVIATAAFTAGAFRLILWWI